MTRTAETYDSNASFWVRIIRENRDRYRSELTDPAVIDAVGLPEGMAILDAGCGEGYLSRILAQKGAIVTGIDSSAELIRAAKTHSLNDTLPVSFDIGNVNRLPYAPNSFDVVLCNHLLNDLEDPAIAIGEFASVLREDGRIIILMLHPCFYNKHAERDQPGNNLLTQTYFETRQITQHFKVDGIQSPAANTAWLRPLEFYTELLRKSGFAITGLTEPRPSPQQIQADDWWRSSFTRPLFMLITAQRW